MALSVALGISSFAMVWLIQPWMLSRGIPTTWFGPLWDYTLCFVAGRIKFEMAFMPDHYLPCDACGGTRYGPELADITWASLIKPLRFCRSLASCQ